MTLQKHSTGYLAGRRAAAAKKRSRTLLAGLAPSVLVLSLCGCASSSAPVKTVTVTAAPVPSSSPTSCPYVGDDNCDGFYEEGEAGFSDGISPSPSPSSAASSKKTYLLFARSTARSSSEPSVRDADDAQLLAWGQAACAEVADGYDITSATAALLITVKPSVPDAQDASELAAEALAALCPKYKS